MDEKEKRLLKKVLNLNDFLISNLTNENIDEILSACRRFENNLRKIIEKPKPRAPAPIWKKFSTMTEEEIIQEFSDVKKYPDLESIKLAVKGYIELRKVSKVKTRETLIKHIIDTYRRGEFISKIGKEKEKSVPAE
jgi:hypothetical protein